MLNLEKEQQEQKAKIEEAKKLLKGKNWRDPAGKKEFVQALYGDVVPEYLWYEIGDLRPSNEELKFLKHFFWGERGPSFGDIELHRSMNRGIRVLLRIRKPKKFIEEIVVGGKPCPLHQIGHSDIFGFGQGGPTCIFSALYG